MSVYVDDMYLYPMGQFGRMKMSHMIAVTDDELHRMAAHIGVARKWFQAPPKHDPHYDIAIAMRQKAVVAGAVEVTLRTLSFMVFVRRETGRLPLPQHAEAERLTLREQFRAEEEHSP